MLFKCRFKVHQEFFGFEWSVGHHYLFIIPTANHNFNQFTTENTIFIKF
jgi:hypothetical protein